MSLHFAPRIVVAALPALLALLHLGLPSQAHAQGIPSDSAIRSLLRTRVDSGTTVGIVVGIVERGRERYLSHGSAGPGRAALDARTIFEIGSISKTFTGLLLAEAVRRGEVKLEQPVAELLPAGTRVPSRDGRQITLEQLATHRSGLPRLPSNLAPANPADPYADYGARQLYSFLAAHTLSRAPGDSVEYSNLGAGLLGHALTLRAKQPSWAALVQDRITGPLAMRETFVEVPPSQRTRLSAGHGNELDAVPAWNFDALAGAGALRSTASDMLRFLGAHLDTTSGTLARSVALVQPPRAGYAAAGMRTALGWIVAGTPTRPIWWHNGGTGGFRSFVAFDPSRQLGVVVLSNSSVSIDDIGMYLMGVGAPAALPFRAPRTTVTLSADAMDRLVGAYALSPTFVLTVTRERDALFVQATGQPKLRLVAVSDNQFVIPVVNAELVFNTSEPGPARHVTLRQNGGTVTAARQ